MWGAGHSGRIAKYLQTSVGTYAASKSWTNTCSQSIHRPEFMFKLKSHCFFNFIFYATAKSNAAVKPTNWKHVQLVLRCQMQVVLGAAHSKCVIYLFFYRKFNPILPLVATRTQSILVSCSDRYKESHRRGGSQVIIQHIHKCAHKDTRMTAATPIQEPAVTGNIVARLMLSPIICWAQWLWHKMHLSERACSTD